VSDPATPDPAPASQRSLVDQVRDGGNRQLQLLAADGLIPVERAELLRLQVWLACSDDGEVAGRAADALGRVEPQVLANAAADVDPETLDTLVEVIAHPLVLEVALQRRDVLVETLHRLASWVPPELQEILLIRQEDLRNHPAILEALEGNPYLTPYTSRVLREYRDYLLPQRQITRVVDPEELDEVTDEMMARAFSAAAIHIPSKGDFDETTGLTDSQIRGLPLAMRVKLAYGASKTLRNILLKDPSPQVAITALNRSAISDREIEQLCQSRAVSEEVLTEVAHHREWVGKYRIMLTLVKNPRTPVNISTTLLPRVATRDLKVLAVDRNVPDSVRSRSRILYRQKTSTA
jgi:hypothetical protein